MSNYPEYVEIEGKKYKINTDFRVAIECNRIAEDGKIGDYERVLAIIYTLFGEEGINTPEHYEKLLKLAKKYLLCGEEDRTSVEEKKDMDYIQDYDLIWTSFYSDYNGLDLDKTEMHWWKFYRLLNGLTNSELGDCCVLNRVRNLRNFDTKDIKDPIQREKILRAKQAVALKKQEKEIKLTEKQQKSVDEFYKALGF